MYSSKALTLYQEGGERKIFGQGLTLILNTFYSTKPIKLQLSVPSKLLLRFALELFFLHHLLPIWNVILKDEF